MDSNRISMVSFVWQAAGLAVMLAMPNSVVALHVGSIIVGLSVGNIVSLSPLVIQHEFAPRSFGLLVGLHNHLGIARWPEMTDLWPLGHGDPLVKSLHARAAPHCVARVSEWPIAGYRRPSADVCGCK